MQLGSEMIYEYLKNCIRFQYYNYGDVLPSVEALCSKFLASDQTVKTVLRRMSKEGYLLTQKGRRARVIYSQSDIQRDEYITRYLSERWTDFTELIKVTEVVFRPILLEGFKRVDKDGYTTLSCFAKQGDLDSLIQFYCFLIQKVNNPLIMNLFWEIALFLGLPFLVKNTSGNYDAKAVAQSLQEFIYIGTLKQWERLDAGLLAFWRKTTGSIIKSIEPYILPIPPEEQVSFIWRIYRKHPQICYSLVIRIMHEIFQGCYEKNHFLPSYDKMAKQYGVSVNTIRRTVQLLTQIGVAQSINGKGTRIYSFGEQLHRPDFTVPAIQRNLALLNRSFELLMYSCESAVYVFMSDLSREERLGLAEQLKIMIRSGRCGFTPWYLLLTFSKQAPTRCLREIFSKIYGLSLWGYPLKASGGRFPNFESTVCRLTELMVEYLESDQIEQCAAAFKEYAVKEYPATKNYLISLGVELDG